MLKFGEYAIFLQIVLCIYLHLLIGSTDITLNDSSYALRTKQYEVSI